MASSTANHPRTLNSACGTSTCGIVLEVEANLEVFYGEWKSRKEIGCPWKTPKLLPVAVADDTLLDGGSRYRFG